MVRRILIVFFSFALVAAQAASWADGPWGEREVKAFHRSDFTDVATAQSVLGQTTSGVFSPDLSWSPLFDGTSESSLWMQIGSQPTFGGARQGLREHLLLIVDDPPIVGSDAAIVGRWAAMDYQASEKEDISKIALTLAVDSGGAIPATVATHLVNIGDSAAGLQNFRLSIASPPSGRIRRLTLTINAMPSVSMIFEDIRLVEHADTPAPAAVSPGAGLPPSGLIPRAAQVVGRFDFDGWGNGNVAILAAAPVGIIDGGGLRICRRPADGSPRRVSVVSVDAPPVVGGDFGVSGTINYGGLDGKADFDGSAYFELTACFPDGTSRVVGTTASFGPCGSITGHSDDRPMELAMHSEMQPTRLQLQLVSDGVGQVGFSNLSIVQFEPPAAVAAGGVPPHWWPWTDQRMIRAAGWGAVVVSALLAIVVMLAPGAWLVRGVGPMVMLGLGEGLFAWGMFLVGRREAIGHIMPLFVGAVAWVLPVMARWVVARRVHERELRKMLTIDAG